MRARAATRINAVTRGVLARRQCPMGAVGRAVVVLQSHARRREAELSLRAAKRAAAAIQATARGKQARKRYQAAREASSRIAAHGRGMLARRRLARSKAAVRTIQQRYRNAREMRRLLGWVDEARKAATRIQRLARGRVHRKAYVGLCEVARAAKAKAEAERAAALKALRREEDSRLHLGLQRTDPAALRRDLLPSGPPDVMELYAASSTELAGARRRRMPKMVPTSDLLSPRLLDLEPKAMLAKLALEQAAIARDPLRNGKYDTSGLADPSIGDFMASRAYRSKPGARRAKARDMGL